VAAPTQPINVVSLDHTWQAFMRHLLEAHTTILPRNRYIVRSTRRLVGIK
jgi:hypothetical protein